MAGSTIELCGRGGPGEGKMEIGRGKRKKGRRRRLWSGL